MTIPTIVTIISGALWLGFMAARINSGGHWIYGWLVDICRILFAVSAFWVVAGTVNRMVF